MDQLEQQFVYRCHKCNWKFNDNNDYVSHSSQDYCTTITDLNDNCLDNIFKHLSYNDLASISLTCKHYKQQAERYFVINQDPKIQPIEIGASFDQIKFYFRQESSCAYEKIFRSLIHSIFVTFNEIAPKKNVFEFIQKNCTKTIRRLNLQVNRNNRYCVPLKGKIHWETSLIANQLKTLTNLKLYDIPGHNLYEQLLVYCENLRTLSINCPQNLGGQSNQYGHKWLHQTYTNLETLELFGNFDGINSEFLDLTNFLHCNQNIKNIYCDGWNVQAIRSVCQSENKFENVTVNFAMLFSAFQNNKHIDWNEIVMWNKRGNCKNLELVFDSVCYETDDRFNFEGNCEYKVAIQIVLNLDNVMALHLHEHVVHFLTAVHHTIASNVRKLCIIVDGSEDTETMFGNLSKTFPNVCELMQYISTDLKENYFLPIVNKFPKLECFTCFAEESCLVNFSNVDLHQLNQQRPESTNARRLNVYINRAHFDKINPILMEERKIIFLKPIDCFECYYCF